MSIISRLARVELQLVMHCLGAQDLVHLALTCHAALHAARHAFAWKHLLLDVTYSVATRVAHTALLRWANTRMTIDVSFQRNAHVIGRVVELWVRDTCFTKRQIVRLFRDVSLAHVTKLHIAHGSHARLWVHKAAHGLPKLQHLNATLRGRTAVLEHVEGAFERLETCELTGDMTHATTFHASWPALHTLCVRRWNVCHPVASTCTHLTLEHMRAETENDWMSFLQHTPCVVDLALHNCQHVKRALRAAAHALPHLRTVHITALHRAIDQRVPDAASIEWLLTQCPRVHCVLTLHGETYAELQRNALRVQSVERLQVKNIPRICTPSFGKSI